MSWHQRLLASTLARIVIALLITGVPFALVATVLNLCVSSRSVKRLAELLLAAIVLGAYASYVRLIEKRPVAELSRQHALREVVAGVLLGAGLLALTIAVLAALGVYQVTGNNGWIAALTVLPAAVRAAVLEEVVMRGIVFRLVERSLGSWIALALSAVIFGALHLLNPGATLLNACAIILEAGILLAAAYMLTRRLWFCIGIHFGWNYTQGGIFSGAVSGGTTKGLLQAKMVGPAWLTGGAFGVEGSAVAITICAAAALVLIVVSVRKGNVVRPFWSHVRAAVAGS
jgi:uncharacterized protein